MDSLKKMNFGAINSDFAALRACTSNCCIGDTTSAHHADATVGTSVMSKSVGHVWLAHMYCLTQCAYEMWEPTGAVAKNLLHV